MVRPQPRPRADTEGSLSYTVNGMSCCFSACARTTAGSGLLLQSKMMGKISRSVGCLWSKCTITLPQWYLKDDCRRTVLTASDPGANNEYTGSRRLYRSDSGLPRTRQCIAHFLLECLDDMKRVDVSFL